MDVIAEEGINCTGSCLNTSVIEPTCIDGIQNGDEEGIDCGGSCPNACEPLCCDGTELSCDDFEDGDWTNNPIWNYFRGNYPVTVTSQASFSGSLGLDFSNSYGTMLKTRVHSGEIATYETGVKANYSVWVYDDGGNRGGNQDSLIETKIYHKDGKSDTVRMGRHNRKVGTGYGCVSESHGICPSDWDYLGEGSIGWHLFEIHVLDSKIEIYIDGNLKRSAEIDATIYMVLIGTNQDTWSGVESYYDSVKLVENIYSTCTDGIQNGDETGIDCGGSCPPCSCEHQILFSDDFSGDLSQWKIWGSPLPYIDSNKGNPAPSLQNNGDSSYQSGMHSRQTFDYSKGLVMEWDVQQDTLGRIFKGGLVGLSKTFDGHSTGGGWYWIGVEWNAANGIFSLVAGDEIINAYTLSTTDWHHIKLVIRSDLFVELYVNDILRATSSKPVSLEFNNHPLETEGREVWFDNIVVKNYCGTTCTDGIQNGDEEGIDCGGSCPNQDCCTNGFKDIDEESVDCGGSCPNACDSCNIENPSVFVAHDRFPKWNDVFTNFKDSLYEWDNMLDFMWYRYTYEKNPLMGIYGSSSSDIDNWPLGMGHSCLSYCPNQDKIIAVSGQFTSKLGNAYIMTLDPDSGDMQIVDYPRSDTYFEIVGDCIYSPQDDSVYILGGWETTKVTDSPRVYHKTTNDVHRFDCKSNTVEQMENDLPGYIGMGYLSGGYSSSDNSIYLFGYGWNNGNYGTGHRADIIRYDLDSKIGEDTGTDLIGVIASTLPIYVPDQNVFLLFGGRSGNAGNRAGTTQVLKYDVAADSITVLPVTLPYPVESAYGGIIREGDNIYLFDNAMENQAMVYNIQDMSVKVIDFVWPTLAPDRFKGSYNDIVQPNPHEFYIASSAHILKAEFSGLCEPTCTDGFQNGDEEGIDCGGSCPNECIAESTCTDGIQNGDEEGIDCGGSCEPCVVEPNCYDGLMNGDEEGIDCGGSCGSRVSCCYNGYWDASLNEHDIDCGGECGFDKDNDGFKDQECGGDDCDDTNKYVKPTLFNYGAILNPFCDCNPYSGPSGQGWNGNGPTIGTIEILGDGIDNDCDGIKDEPTFSQEFVHKTKNPQDIVFGFYDSTPGFIIADKKVSNPKDINLELYSVKGYKKIAEDYLHNIGFQNSLEFNKRGDFYDLLISGDNKLYVSCKRCHYFQPSCGHTIEFSDDIKDIKRTEWGGFFKQESGLLILNNKGLDYGFFSQGLENFEEVINGQYSGIGYHNNRNYLSNDLIIAANGQEISKITLGGSVSSFNQKSDIAKFKNPQFIEVDDGKKSILGVTGEIFYIASSNEIRAYNNKGELLSTLSSYLDIENGKYEEKKFENIKKIYLAKEDSIRDGEQQFLTVIDNNTIINYQITGVIPTDPCIVPPELMRFTACIPYTGLLRLGYTLCELSNELDDAKALSIAKGTLYSSVLSTISMTFLGVDIGTTFECGNAMISGVSGETGYSAKTRKRIKEYLHKEISNAGDRYCEGKNKETCLNTLTQEYLKLLNEHPPTSSEHDDLILNAIIPHSDITYNIKSEGGFLVVDEFSIFNHTITIFWRNLTHNYTLNINGTQNGSFGLDLLQQNLTHVLLTQFVGIKVLNTSRATILLSKSPNVTISMDMDGDGKVEDNISADLVLTYTFEDSDMDGILDREDNCIFQQNPDQYDGDNDSIGDACDICVNDEYNDIDNDGICLPDDNCPFDYNPSQNDSDADGIGDVCDYDNCSDHNETAENICCQGLVPKIALNHTDQELCCYDSECAFNNSCLQSGTQIPVYNSICTNGEWVSSCVENWTCTEWTECTNSWQNRTCIDINQCGTELNKPLLAQECNDCTIPTNNMNITNSTTFCPGKYSLPDGIHINTIEDHSILDCNGAELIGNHIGIGINSTSAIHKNITIKNCIITNYTIGLWFGNFIDSNIYNNKLDFNIIGIWADNISNSQIKNNLFKDDIVGLLIDGDCIGCSKSNTIINNTFNGSQDYSGIYVGAQEFMNLTELYANNFFCIDCIGNYYYRQSDGPRCPDECNGCTIPTNNMNITNSTTFCPGKYSLPDGIHINTIEDNSILDCNGAELIGNHTGIGINSILQIHKNITIKNCIITNYTVGLWFENFIDSNIYNNKLDFNIIGIWADNISNSQINNNLFKDDIVGLLIDGDCIGCSKSNTIINNTFNGSQTHSGIHIGAQEFMNLTELYANNFFCIDCIGNYYYRQSDGPRCPDECNNCSDHNETLENTCCPGLVPKTDLEYISKELCCYDSECAFDDVCLQSGTQIPVYNSICTNGKWVSFCVENWTCTEWTECTNSWQNRTCIDINQCGTELNKPLLAQECNDCTIPTNNMNITTTTTFCPGKYQLPDGIHINTIEDNSMLDCNGAELIGVGKSIGINSILPNFTTGVFKNITIKNCIITNYNTGLWFSGFINSSAYNNNFDYNIIGIWADNISDSQIKNNIFDYNIMGLIIDGECTTCSKYSTIINNTFNGSHAYSGIYIGGQESLNLTEFYGQNFFCIDCIGNYYYRQSDGPRCPDECNNCSSHNETLENICCQGLVPKINIVSIDNELCCYDSECAFDDVCLQSGTQIPVFNSICTNGEWISSCVENWTCTEWTKCTNSWQNRTCIDINQCGTELNKPLLAQECYDYNNSIAGSSRGSSSSRIFYTVSISPTNSSTYIPTRENKEYINNLTQDEAEEDISEDIEIIPPKLTNEQPIDEEDVSGLDAITGRFVSGGNKYSGANKLFISILLIAIIGVITYIFIRKSK